MARRLLGYGGWVTVSSVIGPLLTSLDQFVIGSRLSISAVTYYAVPMNLVFRGQVIPAAMSRTLFPSFSRFDRTDARRLGARATNVLALGFAVFCGPAVIVIRSVLSVWMGPDFALTASPVAEILLIGAWINGVAFIPYGFLQAQGRPDIAAKFHTAEILPFLGILWFATQHFGLVGAASAWTLRCAADAALMLTAARFGRATTLRLLLPGSCVLACYALATCLQLSFVTSWLLAIGIAAGIGTVSLAVDAAIRDILRQMLSRLRTGANVTNSVCS
jgi:O-antigen/teichoic acid export membrane protein